MFSGPPVARLRICVCKFFARRIMGASRHPAFPAPSSQQRAKEESKARAFQAARTLICVQSQEMVLPDRIELSTSPLPMECSTTELRQHVLVKNRAALRGLPSGAISATSPPPVQACRPRQIDKIGPLARRNRPFCSEMTSFRALRFHDIPSRSASWPGPRIRSNLAASLPQPTLRPLSSSHSVASCHRRL